MAKFDKHLGSFFTEGYTQGYCGVSQQDELVFHLYFDESINNDILRIEEEMKQTRLLKKVCWVKTWIYLPELWFTYLLLGRTWYAERKAQQYYYSQMRKGKMNILDFQTGLMNLSDRYLILKGQDNA